MHWTAPCGTGTSARMAQWYAKGKLKEGEEFIHESYIGSQFIGRIEATTTIDGKPAIIPSVEGWAKLRVIIILLSTMKILIGWDFRLCKHIYDTK